MLHFEGFITNGRFTGIISYYTTKLQTDRFDSLTSVVSAMCLLCQREACAFEEVSEAAAAGVTYSSDGALTSSSDLEAAIAALVTPYTWSSSSLSFFIAQDEDDIDASTTYYDEEEYFLGFSSYGENMIRAAFLSWNAISAVDVLETTTVDDADITVGGSEIVITAWAYLPDAGSAAGDIWVGTARSYNGLFVTTSEEAYVGTYDYYVILHEIGHSLGLKHPHTSYGTDTDIMTTDYDALEYTVMSYRSYLGDTAGSLSVWPGNYPQSLMMLDIAAIQEMYGADYTTYSGDTVYSFNLSTGEMYVDGIGTGETAANVVFRTLWDGGGTDLIDLSNYDTSMEVDLAPGGFILLDSDDLYQRAFLGSDNDDVSHYAQANIYMSLLYEDNTASLIENVTTGSGDDVIHGNEADNEIDAGAGTNSIDGDDGTDTVILSSMSSTDAWISVDNDGVMTFLKGSVSTSIENVEYVEFSDTLLSTATLLALYTAAGTSSSVLLNDLLEGGETSRPEPSTDVIGTDYYGGTLSIVEGTDGGDVIRGLSTTATVMSGGDGNDQIWLSYGHDVAIGDDGADRFVLDIRSSSASGIDLILDLDFNEGDAFYIYSSVYGSFSNDIDVYNNYWTGADGELAFITGFADLEEVVASPGVTISDGTYGLVLDFSEMGLDRQVELSGYSMDMFDEYSTTDQGTSTDPGTSVDPGTSDELELTSYTGMGYTSVTGTDGNDTLTMSGDMKVYSGLDGADRFNWDMRSKTGDLSEAIFDLAFDEGDWISILTSQSGVFAESELSDMWTGSDGEFLYIRDMDDLSVAVSSGALTVADGEYGLVLSVNDDAFERTMELAGIWLDDLVVA